MNRTLGEYYPEAKSTHRTGVDYYGGEITVLENEWDDSWQVTQTIPDTRGMDSTAEFRRAFHHFLTEMAVIESLGYEVKTCDDGVAFWERPKD